MSRAWILVLLLGCDGAPLADPITDCITCNRGLESCDLCAGCKRDPSAYAVAGCLPEGTWCADPTADTCRTQLCSECPLAK